MYDKGEVIFSCTVVHTYLWYRYNNLVDGYRYRYRYRYISYYISLSCNCIIVCFVQFCIINFLLVLITGSSFLCLFTIPPRSLKKIRSLFFLSFFHFVEACGISFLSSVSSDLMQFHVRLQLVVCREAGIALLTNVGSRSHVRL